MIKNTLKSVKLVKNYIRRLRKEPEEIFSLFNDSYSNKTIKDYFDKIKNIL